MEKAYIIVGKADLQEIKDNNNTLDIRKYQVYSHRGVKLGKNPNWRQRELNAGGAILVVDPVVKVKEILNKDLNNIEMPIIKNKKEEEVFDIK